MRKLTLLTIPLLVSLSAQAETVLPSLELADEVLSFRIERTSKDCLKAAGSELPKFKEAVDLIKKYGLDKSVFELDPQNKDAYFLKLSVGKSQVDSRNDPANEDFTLITIGRDVRISSVDGDWSYGSFTLRGERSAALRNVVQKRGDKNGNLHLGVTCANSNEGPAPMMLEASCPEADRDCEIGVLKD